MRTKKTSTTLGETVYTLHGKNIVHMTNASHNIDIHFYYGSDGKPVVMNYNGTMYGLLYNVQGDVVALFNEDSDVTVRYRYGAWGELLNCWGPEASTVGFWQPFRYRGYLWDWETGDYYCKDRYYSPKYNRFISADVLVEGNLYSYCSNNPVYYVDEDGTFGIPGLVWPGEIHRAVQKHIVWKSNGKIMMEVQIEQSDGKRGRIDLLDYSSGEYWDVKTCIPLIDAIVDQLGRYLNPNAYLGEYDHPMPDNLERGTSITYGSFTYKSKLGFTFRVEYRQVEPGVIRYLYTSTYETYVKQGAFAAAAAAAPGAARMARDIMNNWGSAGKSIDFWRFGFYQRQN